MCSRPVSPTREERELLKRHGFSPSEAESRRGCDACSGTGFKGRMAIVEAFSSDEIVEEMVLKGERTSAIGGYLKTRGFAPSWRTGWQKWREGETTLAELESAVMS